MNIEQLKQILHEIKYFEKLSIQNTKIYKKAIDGCGYMPPEDKFTEIIQELQSRDLIRIKESYASIYIVSQYDLVLTDLILRGLKLL